MTDHLTGYGILVLWIVLWHDRQIFILISDYTACFYFFFCLPYDLIKVLLQWLTVALFDTCL